MQRTFQTCEPKSVMTGCKQECFILTAGPEDLLLWFQSWVMQQTTCQPRQCVSLGFVYALIMRASEGRLACSLNQHESRVPIVYKPLVLFSPGRNTYRPMQKQEFCWTCDLLCTASKSKISLFLYNHQKRQLICLLILYNLTKVFMLLLYVPFEYFCNQLCFFLLMYSISNIFSLRTGHK